MGAVFFRLGRQLQAPCEACWGGPGMSLKCLVMALLLAVAATGQPLRLTLQQALQLADSGNPELLTSTQGIVVAGSNVTVAAQRPNPTVLLGVPVGPVERKASLVFSLPLETGGRREVRLAVAESGVREAEFSREQLRIGVLNQTRNAFVELAIAEATLEQSRREVEFLERLVEAAQRRFEAGDVAEAEVIRVIFERDQSKRLLYPAENRIQAARVQLNRLLGQPLETQVEAVEDDWLFPSDLTTWEVPELSTLREWARKLRPDLKLVSQQLETAQRRIELAQAEQAPAVALQGSLLWNPVLPAFTYLAGVQVELPWGSDRGGEVEQAFARKEETRLRQQSALLTVDHAVVLAYNNFQAARQQLNHDLGILKPQADRVLMLAEKIYSIGQGDVTEVLLAGQSVQRQRQLLLADYAQLHLALAALELAVNTTLVGGTP